MPVVYRKCDRCSQWIRGIEIEATNDYPGGTGGFYYVGPAYYWTRYSNPGETVVCDNCMHKDERYIREYPYIPPQKKEYRLPMKGVTVGN